MPGNFSSALRHHRSSDNVHRMKTVRDTKIDLRVAQLLAAELRLAAEADGRSMSDYIRRVLISHVVDRPAQTTTQEMPHG